MTTLAFPANPTVGDKYPAAPLANGQQWSWNGAMWALQPGAPAPPAGLPGLGGWADVTAVTGAPVKHAYTDAQGHEWVAYEWTADGGATVTDGMVDALIVGAGAQNASVIGTQAGSGNAGIVISGVRVVAAGTLPITVGQVNDYNKNSALGDVVAAFVTPSANSAAFNSVGVGAAGIAGNYARPFTSAITGTAQTYAAGHGGGGSTSGYGDGGTPALGTTPGGRPGVVIIRVPRANAKA